MLYVGKSSAFHAGEFNVLCSTVSLVIMCTLFSRIYTCEYKYAYIVHGRNFVYIWQCFVTVLRNCKFEL